MLKHLMSGASLLALAVREGENDSGGKTEAQKARDAIAKNVTVSAKSASELAADTGGDKDGDDDGDEGEGEGEGEGEEEAEEGDGDGEGDKEGETVEETPEQKTAREAKEALEAKAKRKDDRVQKRIDRAVAAQKAAETELEKWKAKAEANPDSKLTEEEVQARADALANQKFADAEMARAQKDFEDACDKIQAAALKVDKEFTTKILDITAELGPIPSRVIGILSDFDNGAEVLSFLANDVDEAEKIFDLKAKPERLAIALVRISDKLTEAKKPKPKPLSKVPNPVDPVRGTRVQTTAITEADTKPGNMDNYARKRAQQREAQRKVRGY